MWYSLIFRKIICGKFHGPVFSQNKVRNLLFSINLKNERPTSIYVFSPDLYKSVHDLVNKY